MELGPGERMTERGVEYSAAYLDSRFPVRVIELPDIVTPVGDLYFKTYPASTSEQHARWREAWAMCYCMVVGAFAYVRAHARSIIRHQNLPFFIAATIAAIVVGVIIGFWLPA